MDGSRRGGEPALQDGKREADILASLVVALGSKALGPVHLLAHVIGHLGIEHGLGGRQFVIDGVGPALREQRLPVEGEQLLLGEPAHQVRDVGLMHAVAEAALEAVGIEQRHEELEVFLLAVVGRRRHQQEMPGAAAETLPELMALGVLHLAAEEACRHAVRLVADDQVPVPGGFKLGLKRRVAGEHVEAGDQQVALGEGVGGAGEFHLVSCEDIEGQAELLVKLVLPLLHQRARRDHKAALDVTADH